jgi:serine/threonine protein kinase
VLDRTGQVVEEKYRMIRLIGEGGMGAVYEAEHVIINRRCAVKFLHPEVAQNTEVVKRFVREAQAASSIGHKGIIDIYDVGHAPDGTPFLVMEFLEGKPFSSYLQTGEPLAPAQIVEVLVQALSALGAAHRRGIVHRDIKPENLFVVQFPDAPPIVKLLDFGISKMALGGSPGDRMTRTGTVMGTPYYMAPEQAAGRSDVDHRADLYAMGVILYEALTGRVPFEGENYNQLIVKILTEPIPTPKQLNPAVPDELEQITLRAMERDRDRRFQDAESMIRVLVPLLAAEDRARLGLPLRDTAAVHRLTKTPLSMLTHGGTTAHPGTTPAAQPTEVLTGIGQQSPRRSNAKMIGLVVGLVVAVAVGVTLFFVLRGGGNGEQNPPDDSRVAAATDAGTPLPGPDVGAATKPVPDPALEAALPDAGAVAAPVIPPPPLEVFQAPQQGLEVVTIAIKDLPEGSVVLWGGAQVLDLPFTVEKSTAGRELEVRAPGFETYKILVPPSQDREILFAGTPVRVTGPGPRTRDAGGAATVPADAGAPRPEAAIVVISPADAGTVVAPPADAGASRREAGIRTQFPGGTDAATPPPTDTGTRIRSTFP